MSRGPWFQFPVAGHHGPSRSLPDGCRCATISVRMCYLSAQERPERNKVPDLFWGFAGASNPEERRSMKQGAAVRSPFKLAEALRSCAQGIRRGLIVSLAVTSMIAVYAVASIGSLLSIAGVSGALMVASTQPANARRRRRRYRRRRFRRRRYRRRRWRRRRRGWYRRRRRRRWYRRRRRRGYYYGGCVGVGPVWVCP